MNKVKGNDEGSESGKNPENLSTEQNHAHGEQPHDHSQHHNHNHHGHALTDDNDKSHPDTPAKEDSNDHNLGKSHPHNPNPQVGTSTAPDKNSDTKSFSTTRNIGDPTLSRDSNSRAPAPNSTPFGHNKKKEPLQKTDTPTTAQPGHRRKSSFNKQAILATLGLGKSDDEKSKAKKHGGNGPKHDSPKNQVPEKSKQTKPDVPLGGETAGIQSKKNPESAPDANNKDHPDSSQNPASPSDPTKPPLKGSATENLHNNSEPLNKDPRETVTEPLKVKDDDISAGQGKSKQSTLEPKKFAAVNATPALSSEEKRENPHPSQNTSQYVDPKQFDPKVFAVPSDDNKDNAGLHRGEENDAPIVEPVFEPKEPEEEPMEEPREEPKDENTLDPSKNDSSPSEKPLQHKESNFLDSVMGAVGLGKHHQPSNTEITSQKDGTSPDDYSNVPSKVEKGSLTDKSIADADSEKSHDQMPSHNEIPGTFSSHSKSLVDPSKPTYSTTEHREYTSSGPQGHTRNVSVGDDAPQDAEMSSPHENKTSANDYHYDSSQEAVPRSAQKDQPQEGTDPKEEHQNLIQKMQNQIKSSLR